MWAHTKGPSFRRALSVFLSNLNAANRFQIRKNELRGNVLTIRRHQHQRAERLC